MYNIKKGMKRFASLFMAGVMTVSLAACGKSSTTGDNSSSSAAETPEYVYVPTYVNLETDDEMELYNSQFVGDNIYFTAYDYDDAGNSSIKMYKYSLSENKEISSAVLAANDADSTVNRWINSYCIADDGKIYTIENVYDYTNENNPSNTYMICVYDADYNKLSEEDIGEASGNSDDDYFYINSMVIDGDGRIYLFADSSILLLDSELAYKGTVDASDTWFNSMGVGKDGNVYVSIYDDTENGYVLKSVDFDKKSFGQTYKNFMSGNSGNKLVKGIDGDFLLNDGTKVYEYSLETQTTTELFTWLDSDIFGDYVNNMSATDDGRIIAAIYDWSSGENEVAYLTKTKSSELAQKEQITIGVLYTSQDMQAAAVAFNKESDKYHVNFKYYRDTNDYSETAYSDAITSMNSDIVSSSCPDLVEISGINIPQLAAKGAFEDLSTWLDKSSSLSKSDFYENIIDSATYNDCLVYIPRTFNIQTLSGKTSVVGEKRGWSIDDIIALSKEYPDAQLMEYGTKSSMLYYMMAYNQDSFIDYTTGKCSFDSDGFKKILEFVASFPDEYDWSDDGDSTPTKLSNGQILLYSDYISELEDLQLAPALFGEDVTFIGYPTVDGSVGCMLNTNGGYAMLSKAQNKEGAWAFIEYYLNRDDTMFSWGFPSKKADMQALIDDALDIEYLTDENGQLVLDEDGNPISTESHGGMGWDDWEYEYRDVTQEEVDLFLELVAEASPASDTDDQIMSIITEETESYFAGQKSVDDVASVIQSRIQLYINENS